MGKIPHPDPLAALGLSLVREGTMVYHATSGEYQNIGLNLLHLAATAFVASRSWKLKPLEDRSQAAEAEDYPVLIP